MMQNQEECEYQGEIRDFQKRVAEVRRSLSAAMASGHIPEKIKSNIDELRCKERTLLEKLLPAYRIRQLDREDIGVEITPFLQDLEKYASDPENSEEELSETEMKLCLRLLDVESIPEEPEIPETGEDRQDVSRAEKSGRGVSRTGETAPESSGEDGRTAPECFLWLCVRGPGSAFAFGDDGTVWLYEQDRGQWRRRCRPILTEVFAENAVMESDSSCLIRNVDGGVDRIHYDRIENAEQITEARIFE